MADTGRLQLFEKLALPSAILQHALDDYLTVLSQPQRYQLDSSRWVDRDPVTGLTLVNFAGSVLAITYGREITGYYQAPKASVGVSPMMITLFSSRIIGLDFYSEGEIGSYLSCIDENDDLYDHRRGIIRYNPRERVTLPDFVAQPAEFIEATRKFIETLKTRKL